MTDQSFPPLAKHSEQIAVLLKAFASVVDSRAAFYVSSPLTTGQRAFEWHLRNGGSHSAHAEPSAQFLREVIEPNREQAARYVRDLRRKTGKVVIDPTALEDQPKWTQADYRVFWGQIIEKYVDAVAFRDGWQYSSGCAYEFLIAYDSQARLLREDLTTLPVEEGASLIAHAIDETNRRGASTEFLRDVYGALRGRTSLNQGAR